MVVLQDPHYRGPQISLFPHRRADSSLPSDHSSQLSGSYIILALVFVILGSLLLVALLQYQSRRIDQRLQAVIAAHHPRPPLPRSRAPTHTPAPFIPSARPPASFPSVSSCHGSIPDPSVHSDDSINTNSTMPPVTSRLIDSHLKETTFLDTDPHTPTFKFMDDFDYPSTSPNSSP
ncbi:hypothetical protein VP01_547g2 [Puccinia sorghi]|uniref:Uncharacterized protein n=1 Tax=Puccinia sorghi TaxID=27349 RepID=A0A0L6UJK2_9BASI|nr:hypothetical protein VP01_547g2 [Puccinia sorghi]